MHAGEKGSPSPPPLPASPPACHVAPAHHHHLPYLLFHASPCLVLPVMVRMPLFCHPTLYLPCCSLLLPLPATCHLPMPGLVLIYTPACLPACHLMPTTFAFLPLPAYTHLPCLPATTALPSCLPAPTCVYCRVWLPTMHARIYGTVTVGLFYNHCPFCHAHTPHTLPACHPGDVIVPTLPAFFVTCFTCPHLVNHASHCHHVHAMHACQFTTLLPCYCLPSPTPLPTPCPSLLFLFLPHQPLPLLTHFPPQHLPL